MRRNIHILFVEDDLSNKFLLELTFKNSLYNFQIAVNGRDALKKVVENNFDIVFLDIQLPDMDGFEVAKKIRALEDPFKCNIPIISMSANEPFGDDLKFQLKSAGITGYINKPFTEEEIDGKISESLNYDAQNKNQINFFSINDDLTTVIDNDRLMKIAKGDPLLIKNMIDILFRQKEDSFIKFESALKKKDWKLVENTAHSLKSSIIFFGMGFLYDTMDKIERYALEGKKLDEIPGLINLVKSGLNKSVEELNKTYDK
jgi:CheY-like chemotaxis protein